MLFFNAEADRCNDHGSVRLVNKMNETNEGRLELCYNGQWGTVCDRSFGLIDGRVACRQLGFEGITHKSVNPAG